ncbi:MAG: hypothetical protein ACJ76Z_06820 [Thermoleophilaceae bacterium]
MSGVDQAQGGGDTGRRRNRQPREPVDPGCLGDGEKRHERREVIRVRARIAGHPHQQQQGEQGLRRTNAPPAPPQQRQPGGGRDDQPVRSPIERVRDRVHVVELDDMR